MKGTSSIVAAFVALAMVAMPAAANPRDPAFVSAGDPAQSRPFMFTGITARLSLDGRTANRKPEVALRFAGGVRNGALAPKIGDGLAFSVVPGAKPKVTLAGQDTKVIGTRLQMSDGAKIALIAGGAVVLIGALVLIVDDTVDDINREDGCCL